MESVALPGSLVNDMILESPYYNESDPHHIPSPPAQQDDSDEYTSTRQSIRSGSIWVTPSQRSKTSSIASNTRTALEGLYKAIYGKDSIRCLVTLGKGGLNVAHAVRRASKSHELSLYEYCLGFEQGTFHVDSRQNIFYLQSNWHYQFDTNRWLLLPSIAVLEEVRDFIGSVISARTESAPADTPDIYSKWPLKIKTKYTFIPLPSIEKDPITRPKPMRQWDTHSYPYDTLPDLECHIAPPFAVINGGAKCVAADLDAITLDCCQSIDLRPVLKRRLELLREIWKTFQNAKEDESNWERTKRGKRRREQEEEEIERLSQSSRCTTRSQSHIVEGPSGNNVKHGSKRKASPSSCGTTLTEHAVLHFSKRQKTSDSRTTVKRWMESIHG